jgi:16S rRNA (adenine1518-N6/adenine1519-N6)-dimethyltransferase
VFGILNPKMTVSELNNLPVDFSPNRALGQNFLVSQRAISIIVESLQLSSDDLVLEIGPGTGNLTLPLVQKAGFLVAVEIDRRFQQILQKKMADFLGSKLRLIWADILNIDLPKTIQELGEQDRVIKIAANLPYYATTDIMLKLITALPSARMLVLMVQREAVARITADPGTKEYGPLAVMVSLYGNVKTIMRLPGSAFEPQPPVESALLKLTPTDSSLLRDSVFAQNFAEFLLYAFQERRKQFMGRLRRDRQIAKDSQREDKLISYLEQSGIRRNFRIEELRPDQLLSLYDHLHKISCLPSN